MIKLTSTLGKIFYINSFYIIEFEIDGSETKLKINDGNGYYYRNVKETPEEINLKITI